MIHIAGSTRVRQTLRAWAWSLPHFVSNMLCLKKIWHVNGPSSLLLPVVTLLLSVSLLYETNQPSSLCIFPILYPVVVVVGLSSETPRLSSSHSSSFHASLSKCPVVFVHPSIHPSVWFDESFFLFLSVNVSDWIGVKVQASAHLHKRLQFCWTINRPPGRPLEGALERFREGEWNAWRMLEMAARHWANCSPDPQESTCGAMKNRTEDNGTGSVVYSSSLRCSRGCFFLCFCLFFPYNPFVFFLVPNIAAAVTRYSCHPFKPSVIIRSRCCLISLVPM